MSHYRPFRRTFRRISWLAPLAIAALVLSPARAEVVQTAQQAALSDNAKSESAKTDSAKTDIPKSDIAKSDVTKPAASQTIGAGGAGTVAAVDQANPSPQKSLAAKALEKAKEVAKSAGDIFSRVPCLPPKGGATSMGSLPHVAGKLAAGEPVVIIAFGSSSTAGYGTTSPEFTYPNRLAAQLHRQYPGANITVLNRGIGGEDAPEMMKRLQSQVIDAKPKPR
jgi:hypothetical protein